MLTYRYPIIAREGWMWIMFATIAAAVGYFFISWLSMPLWLIVLLLLFIFRDPACVVPSAPLGVVSPVAGEVLRVETVVDEYCGRSAICISIGMSLTNVYSMRSPIEGKIMQQWLAVPRKIRFQNAEAEESHVKTFAQWIQSDEGDDVVMVIEQGLLTSRPQCYAHSGERIGQGQRCGYIRFGARVHVLVPETTRINVAVGDLVYAGSDIIGTLVHAEVRPPKIVAA